MSMSKRNGVPCGMWSPMMPFLMILAIIVMVVVGGRKKTVDATVEVTTNAPLAEEVVAVTNEPVEIEFSVRPRLANGETNAK